MTGKTLFVVSIFLSLLASTAQAQESDRQQTIVGLSNSGFVAFTTRTAEINALNRASGFPEAVAMLTPQMLVDRNVIHRVLVDGNSKIVFGYDLSIESLTISKQFKVTVKPLDEEFVQQLRAGKAAFAALRFQRDGVIPTLPRATGAQMIEDGDAFALDLLVNRQTGIKIVDLVKVSYDRLRLNAPLAKPRPARDFTLNNVELAVRNFKLVVNEKEIAREASARLIAGAIVWFYVPGQGRFIFSLAPHAGYDFQKVGVIDQNKISFEIGGNRYEWISGAPIIAGSDDGVWNLWVLHDPAYNPDIFSPDAVAQNTQTNAGTPATPITSQWLSFDPTFLHNGGNKPPQRTGLVLKPKPQNAREASTVNKTATAPPKKPLRLRIGSADRIENVLPQR